MPAGGNGWDCQIVQAVALRTSISIDKRGRRAVAGIVAGSEEVNGDGASSPIEVLRGQRANSAKAWPPNDTRVRGAGPPRKTFVRRNRGPPRISCMLHGSPDGLQHLGLRAAVDLDLRLSLKLWPGTHRGIPVNSRLHVHKPVDTGANPPA